MGGDTDVLLATERGFIFLGCLFALFCASVEVERLGHAFESDEKVATAEATMRP